MRVYKKSDHISCIKTNNENKIVIVSQMGIDDIKKDKYYYSLFKESIEDAINENTKFVLYIGSKNRPTILLPKDKDNVMEICTRSLHSTFWLESSELNILKSIAL